MPQSLPNVLLPLHEQAGAELQPYADLQIVSTFGEPQAEYAFVRSRCGLMDLPQRGVLELTGRDRLAFLNNLVTNLTWDKSAKTGLAAGQGVYAFFLNVKGRIVADMNILERGDRTWLDMDARLVEPLRSVFDMYLFGEQVKMVSRVGTLHQMALHGPGAPDVLRELGVTDTEALAEAGSLSRRLFDVDVTIFRDDVCGVPGLNLLVDESAAANVWQGLLATFGQSEIPGKARLRPVGWAAFNATRIEAGRPLFGIDFDGVPTATAFPSRKARDAHDEAASDAPQPGVLAAETGQLSRAVSFKKGCYLGQEIVARMHARGQVAKQIVGLKMEDDSLPIAGAPLQDDKSNQVGGITSSTLSPVLSNRAICLGFVKKPFIPVGSVVQVPAEGQMRTATVVALPFLPATPQ